MEARLLDILVCPICKGSLHYNRQQQELICKADQLAFPIQDGIPVMLESQARDLRKQNAGTTGQSDQEHTESGAGSQ